MKEAVPTFDIFVGIPPALQSSEFLSGELKDEAKMTEHIEYYRKIHQGYEKAIGAERIRMKGVESGLGQLLFNLKQLLARSGRNGQWSAWLRERRISRAAADGLVLQFAARLPGSEFPQGQFAGRLKLIS